MIALVSLLEETPEACVPSLPCEMVAVYKHLGLRLPSLQKLEK